MAHFVFGSSLAGLWSAYTQIFGPRTGCRRGVATEAKGPAKMEDALQAGRSLWDKFFPNPVSAAMRELEKIIVEIAPTDLPILIVGESGSGKEAIARQIHELSFRSSAPFAKLVCATVTPQNSEKLFCFDDSSELVESLLNAGTIFLDEISYLDPDVQSRLLHILPDGGPAIADHGLQARIISSTAQSLQEEIRQGHFRKDLYYRLNGVCLRVPPLRGRREDIPLLVEFLLIKYAAVLNRPKPSLTTQALEKLVRYHWPGNVRQLEYAMKAVVALGDGDQALQELDENEFGFEEGEPQELSLKQTARAASRRAEREMILKALERTRWNRRKAARQLRISYRALLYKLKQIGSDGVLCQSDYHGERS